jgi:hypothetical protein
MLSLFKAKTEDEVRRLEEMDVPILQQTVQAYRQVSASSEFRELERLRSLARHNEASALANARRLEREQMQVEMDAALADKDAEIADKDAALADKDAALAGKDAVLADKDAALADKDAALADKDAALATALAEIERLRSRGN